ncbi:hypothetical protein [Helicobacter sp. 23-1045]
MLAHNDEFRADSAFFRARFCDSHTNFAESNIFAESTLFDTNKMP